MQLILHFCALYGKQNNVLTPKIPDSKNDASYLLCFCIITLNVVYAERLYRKAKERSLGVSRRAVRDWLKTQDTYTRYKPIARKHKYRKTLVKDLADHAGAVGPGGYGKVRKQEQGVPLDTNGLRNSEPIRLCNPRPHEGRREHDEGRRTASGKV